ncbi:MAG TPA: ADP-ribosylglycohydrolase family protein [Ktedonobacteraceae bacterium]
MSVAQEKTRLQRALISLEGLAMGDAFGRTFFSFSAGRYHHYYETRALPEAKEGSWSYTDDTQTALSLVETLRRFHAIDQDQLMASFVAHYEPGRAYGAGMHELLRTLREKSGPAEKNVEATAEDEMKSVMPTNGPGAGTAGTVIPAWRELVAAQFTGEGSSGNGAAMRAAPLGAYFAGTPQRVVSQARLSATVTHTHPEAVAGAIAVAMAAALAWQHRARQQRPARSELIEHVLRFVPPGAVYDSLLQASKLAPHTSAPDAASLLGSGYRISAQDTVPFALWCAGQFLDNYEEALWQTASGLGDIDTTCAIVGGIVVLYTGMEGIPANWLQKREPLATWALGQ